MEIARLDWNNEPDYTGFFDSAESSIAAKDRLLAQLQKDGKEGGVLTLTMLDMTPDEFHATQLFSYADWRCGPEVFLAASKT